MRILFILFLASCLVAEERGRLPDGRAFRTDSDGNQVIDYIAELETTVDALTQQVILLEDKVSGSIANQQNCPPQAACPALSCPEPVSCENEVQAAVRNVLDRNQKELSNVESTFAETRRELELLRTELERERSKARSLDSEVSTLRASMRAPSELPIPAPRLESRTESRPDVSPALVSLRSTVLTEINRLKGRLSKRDALFKGGTILAGAVKIKATDARTSSGKTLDHLRGEASEAKSLRDLAEIRRGLYQIREIIESDIRDAERLNR